MPVTCYICGRDFGKKSLGIHLPICKRKFESEQKSLPQHLRKHEPAAPVLLMKLLDEEGMTKEELEEYNKDAINIWNNETLVKCENCSRYKLLTFNNVICNIIIILFQYGFAQDLPYPRFTQPTEHLPKAFCKHFSIYPRFTQNKAIFGVLPSKILGNSLLELSNE